MSKNHAKNVALTASLLALMSTGATAEDYKKISKSGKEGDQITEHSAGDFVVKCVGAAKGGENDCGAVDGSHACAGLSDAGDDNSDNEWVYLKLSDCADHPNGKFLVKTDDGPTVLSKTEFQFKLVEK